MLTLADTMISLSLNELMAVATVALMVASPIVVLLWKIQSKVSRLCDRLGVMHDRIEDQCARLERVERVIFRPAPGLGMSGGGA